MERILKGWTCGADLKGWQVSVAPVRCRAASENSIKGLEWLCDVSMGCGVGVRTFYVFRLKAPEGQYGQI